MRTRKAILPGAPQIHGLISAMQAMARCCPRTLAEICENIRILLSSKMAVQLLAAERVHLYGTHLAENSLHHGGFGRARQRRRRSAW